VYSSQLYSSVTLKSLKLASVKFFLNIHNRCDRSTFTLGRILKRPRTLGHKFTKNIMWIYDATKNYYAK